MILLVVLDAEHVVAAVVVDVDGLVALFGQTLLKGFSQLSLDVGLKDGDLLTLRHYQPLICLGFKEWSLDGHLPSKISANLGLSIDNLPLAIELSIKLDLIDIIARCDIDLLSFLGVHISLITCFQLLGTLLIQGCESQAVEEIILLFFLLLNNIVASKYAKALLVQLVLDYLLNSIIILEEPLDLLDLLAVQLNQGLVLL